METYIIIHQSTYGIDLYRVHTDEMFFTELVEESEEVQQAVADHLQFTYNPDVDNLIVLSDQSINEIGRPLVLDTTP